METISETNVGKFPNAIVDFGFVEWSCWLNSIEVHWNEDHGDLEWKKIMRSKFPHFFLVFCLLEACVAKGLMKLPNLLMLMKQVSITFQKLGSWDFWQIANSSVLNNGKSVIPPLFNGREVCLWYLIKQSCLLKTFLRILLLWSLSRLSTCSPF